jgi:hypothetical protein
MSRAGAAASLVAVVFFAGCGSSDSAVKRDLLRGVAEIRTTHDAKKLQSKLRGTLARLRRDRASTDAARRAKALGIAGLVATLNGLQGQIDFYENDSGNIETATRDAVRADRGRKRGAILLRAAGRALGLRIGTLGER